MTRPVSIPDSVQTFLVAAAPFRDQTLRINPLSLDECTSETAALREIDIVALLRLIVLDDANDSNPYCYIDAGPARGMVVHFSHDPGPVLRFPDLSAFLHALRFAHETRADIDDLCFPEFPPARDQLALVARLNELLGGSDEDAALQATLYLPLLDPLDLATLAQFTRADDFFLREAASLFIRDHYVPTHRDLAELLATDKYPQVARPAQDALRTHGLKSE